MRQGKIYPYHGMVTIKDTCGQSARYPKKSKEEQAMKKVNCIYRIETRGSGEGVEYSTTFKAAEKHLIGQGYRCVQEYSEEDNIAGIYHHDSTDILPAIERRIVSIRAY